MSRVLRPVGVFGFALAAAAFGWWFVGAVMDHKAGPHLWLHTGSVLVYGLQVLGAFAGLKFAVATLEWLGPRRAPSSTHGSARFADPREVLAELGGGDEGLIVGRELNGRRLLRYAGPSHLITMAPTRSGKGVGTVIPNLLTADRSILCIDPKGENARVTLPARRRFGAVHVLDPFEITGCPGAAFNPLSALDAESLDVSEDAARLADALVYDPPQQVSDAHWNEEARALLSGLILHVISSEPPQRRTLSTVRRLLTLPPVGVAELLEDMSASTAAGGLVARAANRQLGKSDREAAGVLSSAQRHTHFLDSPRMARVMARSDFTFADLRAGVVTVFLVLPPDRLATHARWLRLMTVQALGDLVRAPAGDAASVLMLLDEFAALGRLEPIEQAFALMAGYGVQLWPILQDLHQLRATYGERAGTFLSNAGLLQMFNVADVDTATWVSRTLGVSTEIYATASSSVSSGGTQPFSTHSDATNVHEVRRDLLTPDEVMRLGADRQLLLRPGGSPVVARKVRYFEDAEFTSAA